MEECCCQSKEKIQYYKSQLNSLRIEWMYMQEKESLMSKIVENKDRRIKSLMCELQTIKESLSSNYKVRRASRKKKITEPSMKRTIKIVRRHTKSQSNGDLHNMEPEKGERCIIYNSWASTKLKKKLKYIHLYSLYNPIKKMFCLNNLKYVFLLHNSCKCKKSLGTEIEKIKKSPPRKLFSKV